VEQLGKSSEGMQMSSSTKAVHSLATAQITLATPLGPLLLARTAQGLAGAWFEGQKDHPGQLTAPEKIDDAVLMQAAAQLNEYFNGTRQEFDLTLDLHGTEFQCNVWRALLKIDLGATQSYGDIARAVNSPQGVRAVGAAVGKNPLSVIVPCHRVMGSDGSLTGYAGGLDRKRALLKLEGVALQEKFQEMLL
jgi:methylated-DNA-[protein]-cysteine S-methyltransferase